MLDLNSQLRNIHGVGKSIASRLKKIGLETIEDLLFYFPFRYEDYSRQAKISELQTGTNVNIVGAIELIHNKKSPRKRISITEAIISDQTDQMKIIWFNQPFISKNLKPGDMVSLSGKVEQDYTGIIMKSPNYEKITNNQSLHTQGLIPMYHLTANITQKQIRFLIKQIIHLSSLLTDWLPKETIRRQGLLSLKEAIWNIHFPKNFSDTEQAKKRLAFNELFLIQLRSQIIKNDIAGKTAESIKFKEKETQEFVKNLPFQLTDDQKKASWQVLQDMEKEKSMSRLLQGDVGSGKTIVAVIAMLNTALNKKQSVLMVPTEILAGQHFNSVCKILKNFNLKIGLISRTAKMANFDIKSEKKKDIPRKIAEGAQIIIGTHALIQEKIKFKNLALTIVDEQHRFGVAQRKTITEKSGNNKTTPHLLSMTATPIPRSLALALFGDLSVSVINEMPKGRKPIITSIITETNRAQAYEFIKKEIKAGRQAFVICPLIDISDNLGVKSVKEEYEKLDKNIFPDLKINMLHGKLKAEEKNEIMEKFLQNKTNILVSTSVIEVGVDMPNATIMLIEGADRFGLAQLHQFRGRVGRSNIQSYCFLSSDNNGQKTLDRLHSMVKYNSGFDLAKIDLKFRGPGEIYGIAQTGFPELQIASIFDYPLIETVDTEVKTIIDKLDKYPFLQEKIKKFQEEAHFE
ncbi:ATP-dependent DNA helicase RecG [Candidatus Falkowbacteria bacterium RIFOXYB2_FULL_34_18]|uniref:ATP-dependent DNA helicase RecG n=1 Tax=Candidatus Falkowbacteria bacterium RIFOXYD2_FULL_34_120 TaxID=1798007 RepID=A0A1F5TR31_9BACT|nr:MAG: ATP-dependent DNA helicase RecG [Candidatus Falkowbacteria bacterium RIFOXYB2_FULL_34_18]OGF30009.1 MAG: ATP-dependent DNA helicase RecG [Candidatus Falkowbacteria bacterium RIFOXYC12_FULL_34_55]OGF37134.1 MAG: ATP-dependent DNA helicase RecG [Candidatus Falkowbacteria bacterium RIFOXYC2_FULL_34_220]OGF39545.1 MAG: ATP-dependent DNA helicase RecG [Candidatus Falkowbacteria bacterium RIFOXYD12_FULL_34_57]OGF41472.1 MAG: ATP-dependent DNA helicase RecG [Candidatus Falkowbacteria bacterium